MAKLILVLTFFAGLATLGSSAESTKGAMKEITMRTVECDKKVTYSPSKSLNDCADKCKKDANCRFASYQSKANKCGLVPNSNDCIFKRAEDNSVIGFAYKKFNERDKVRIDSPPLKDKKGQAVLDGSYGTPGAECQAMCDIHPTCKAAQWSSMRGENACTLLAKSGPTNKLGADYRGSSIAYTAA